MTETTVVYRVEHPSDGRGPFARRDMPHGECRDTTYPGTRFVHWPGMSGYLQPMHHDTGKSAFVSPWAAWCYFAEQVPHLDALGYVMAEYRAPVLCRDDCQCVIPVNTQPRRVVRLRDLREVAA